MRWSGFSWIGEFELCWLWEIVLLGDFEADNRGKARVSGAIFVDGGDFVLSCLMGSSRHVLCCKIGSGGGTNKREETRGSFIISVDMEKLVLNDWMGLSRRNFFENR